MSDYLENLAARATGKHNFLQPRVPSLFEPAFSQEPFRSPLVPDGDSFRMRPAAQSRRSAIESADPMADAVRSGDMPSANLPIRAEPSQAEAALEKRNYYLNEDGIDPLESNSIEKGPENTAEKSAPGSLSDLNIFGGNRRGDGYQDDKAKPPATGNDEGARGSDYENLHNALSQNSRAGNSQRNGHLQRTGDSQMRRHHQNVENSEEIFYQIKSLKTDKSNLENSISKGINENGRIIEKGIENNRHLGSRIMEPNLIENIRQIENSVLPGERPVSSLGILHATTASPQALRIEQQKKLQKPIAASLEQHEQAPSSIKITIGRIEVRAVKPPEKREAKKVINQPSSSLDDYLASLRGRSR